MFCTDLLFTPETAARARAEMRRQGRGQCACEGGKCPLLPADLSLLFRRPPVPGAGDGAEGASS